MPSNTIAVSAIMETRRIRQGVDQIEGHFRRFDGATKRVGSGIKKAFVLGAAAVGIREVSGAVGDMLAEARESQKVGAITVNTIKATGGAANVTARDVGRLATSISNKTGMDDEAIQTGANLLLTFKNVRNEAGAGNKVFNDATAAAADLAASGFGSVDSASKTLGKALNDPLKGISALSRAGVTFTQGQKDQIAALVESGDTLKAQKIILREVQGQVGGNAAAAATNGEKFRTMVDNIKESIGAKMLPALDRVQAYMIDKLPGWIGTAETALGKIRFTFAAIAPAGRPVLSFLQTFGPALLAGGTAWLVISKSIATYKAAVLAVKGAQIALNLAMTANPIGLVVAAIAVLVGAFVFAYQNSERFRTIVNAAFSRVRAAASALGRGVKAGIGFAVSAVRVGGSAVKAAIVLYTLPFRLVVAGAKALASGVRSSIGNAVSTVRNLGSRVKSAASAAGTWLKNAGRNVIEGLVAGIKSAPGLIADAIGGVANYIKNKIKEKLKINSPSRLVRPLGRSVPEGIAVGILDGRTEIRSSLNKVSDVIASHRLPQLDLSASLGKAKDVLSVGAYPGLGLPQQAPQIVNLTVNINGQTFVTKAEVGKSVDESLRAARDLGLIRKVPS